MSHLNPLFDTGRIVSTPGAMAIMSENSINGLALLKRHVSGDFGDLTADDIASNKAAVKTDERILSAYNVNNCRLWIITEADRSSTCILLPEEY